MRISLLLVFSLFAQLSVAQELQSKDVENWLDTLPPIQAWLDQQEHNLPDTEPPEDIGNIEKMMEFSIKKLKAAGVYDEFEKKVQAAGYQNVPQWGRLSQRISLAFMAVQQDNEPISRDAIEQQIQQLKTLDMPPENKQMMEKMLRGSLAMIDAINAVSAKDKAAVRPHIDRLLEQFGAQD